MCAALFLGAACGDDDGSGGAQGGAGGGPAGGGGATSTGATGGGGADAGGAGGGMCTEDCQGFPCCGTTCVNKENDINNCGECGVQCEGPNPYCDLGECGSAPCDPLTDCNGTDTCCGTECCTAGKLCCEIPGPVGSAITCVDPTAEGTCPMGCVLCACTSGDTMIATPTGERAISSIQVGDLVYSIDAGSSKAVPVLIAQRKPVANHRVIELVLANGRTLHVTGAHPTADGRTFNDLHAGGQLDGVGILSAREVPFEGDATYDILPASSTGAYVANGVLIGTTQRGRVNAMP